MDASTGFGGLGWCARRPMVAAAALFMFGIVLHRWAPGSAWPYLWLGGLMLGCSVAGGAWRGMGCGCLAVAMVAAGTAGGRREAFFFAGDEIGLFTRAAPRLARIEMVIEQPPRVLDAAGRLPGRQAAWGRAVRVLTQEGWQRASGGVLLRVDEVVADLAAGQRVEVFGMLARPRGAMNPGEMDWQAYYRTERVLAVVRVSHGQNVKVLESRGPGWLLRLRSSVRELLARGFHEERSLEHALLRALVLGDHDPQLRDVQEDFRRTGTSHHLAISGMHVAVLGALVFGACRCLFLAPRRAAVVGILFVVSYGLAAMPSAPVIRSVLLCAIFAAGIVCRRAVDGVQLLAVVVTAMLIARPLDLYNAGFALSFGTVLGLMVLTRPLITWMESWRDRDVVIAESVQRPTVGQALWRWCRARTVQVGAAAGVAWAVASPLVAMHFEQFNPWSILASLLLAVPVFLALVGGLVKIVLTLVVPGGAELWAGLTGSLVRFMRWSVEVLGTLPGSDWPVGMMQAWVVMLVYGMMAMPLVPWVRRMRWRLAGPVVACGLIVVAPLLGAAERVPAGRLTVTLLSVGAGQCAVVHLPSGRCILMDAGSSSVPDLWRMVIHPYLRKTGAEINAVVVSHANVDHYSAVADVLEEGGAKRVYLGAHFEKQAAESARAVLKLIGDRGAARILLRAGDRLELDEQTVLEAIWPMEGPDLKANDSSLVLRLRFKGRTILFTGDIQAAAQRQLLIDPAGLHADVLIAPHHGSTEETTGPFLRAVDPAIILSSNDATLSQKQRELEKLAKGRTVMRTHQLGALTASIDEQGVVEVRSFRRQP